MSAGKSLHPLCSEVARVFRSERERRGLSMNQLAAMAGLSQQMVSYVERGLRNPTLDTLSRIADALETPLWKLIRMARNTEGSARN